MTKDHDRFRWGGFDVLMVVLLVALPLLQVALGRLPPYFALVPLLTVAGGAMMILAGHSPFVHNRLLLWTGLTVAFAGCLVYLLASLHLCASQVGFVALWTGYRSYAMGRGNKDSE